MINQIVSVLVIEDSNTDAKLIEVNHPSTNYKITRVSSLNNTIELLDEVHKYDVILLDLNLLIRYIKQMEEACRVDRETFSEQVISTWEELTQRLSTLYASLRSARESDDFVKWASEYSKDSS
jgi:CheY-like chemotaxis protein